MQYRLVSNNPVYCVMQSYSSYNYYGTEINKKIKIYSNK